MFTKWIKRRLRGVWGVPDVTKEEFSFQALLGQPAQGSSLQAVVPSRLEKMVAQHLVVWFVAVLQAISAYGAELSSEVCRDVGFSSNLLCSSCDLLGPFGLNEVSASCRQCCQEEAQLESIKRYAGAILEVCG
uniref:Selenoprotein F n=1 Tax=Leptobrachium leishanense TaxID=445787 RepID=A0A8C5R6T0_9ANUR